MNILVLVGAVFALLYIVNAFVGVRRGDGAFSAVSGLVLIVAASLLVGAVAFAGASVVPVFIVSGVLLVASAVIYFMERRITHPGRFGMGGVIAALLILGGVFATPYIDSGVESYFEDRQTTDLVTQVAQARTAANSRADVPLQSADADSLPVIDFEAQPQPTRPTAEPTLTPTPFTYSLPTPVPPICNATVNANVNFREQPELTGDLITVIPEGAILNIYERDETGEWLQTIFDERRGWVSITVVTLEPGCE